MYGKISDKIKVCILLFQIILRGMCQYSDLVGRSQTLNKNNDLCATVFESCDIAAGQSQDTVLLNVSIYGVLCEVE